MLGRDVSMSSGWLPCWAFLIYRLKDALNMTMHNGQFGCISCEEPGQHVQQGRGGARTYAHKTPDQKPAMRTSDKLKQQAINASDRNRVQGIKGPTGLSTMHWFDLVNGIVPDYMHGVLMGVTKALLAKWFSAKNSGRGYFLGKSLEEISKIKPK